MELMQKTCFSFIYKITDPICTENRFHIHINLTAKMQSPSQLMHASESLCVTNCQLNFQYKTATQWGTAPAEK